MQRRAIVAAVVAVALVMATWLAFRPSPDVQEAARYGLNADELRAYRGEVRATARAMGMTPEEADGYVKQNATAERLAHVKKMAQDAVCATHGTDGGSPR